MGLILKVLVCIQVLVYLHSSIKEYKMFPQKCNYLKKYAIIFIYSGKDADSAFSASLSHDKMYSQYRWLCFARTEKINISTVLPINMHKNHYTALTWKYSVLESALFFSSSGFQNKTTKILLVFINSFKDNISRKA